jgi:hypothetical protein
MIAMKFYLMGYAKSMVRQCSVSLGMNRWYFARPDGSAPSIANISPRARFFWRHTRGRFLPVESSILGMIARGRPFALGRPYATIDDQYSSDETGPSSESPCDGRHQRGFRKKAKLVKFA